MNNHLSVGDTNLDIIKWASPDSAHENMVESVKTEITTRNFHQMIQEPTRFWVGTRPSLLDQCWGNNILKMSNIKNLTRGTADHNVIGLNYRLKGNIINNMEVKGRDRRHFSEEEFKRQIVLQDWTEIFEEENVDVATFKFENKLLKVLDSLAPMKKFQPRAGRIDWISDNTKRIMKDRDEMRDKAARSSQLEDWEDYKVLRNLCNKSVKKDRSDNSKKLFENLHERKDSKGLYTLVKRKMGWKPAGAPEIFVIDGEKISNPKKMADVQMKFFKEKVENLKNKLPPQKNDPLVHLKSALQRWGKADSIPELVIQKVTSSQVEAAIKSLNSSHAFGHCGIDSSSLKMVASSIAAPISHIINQSVLKKRFPCRWKFGRLIPLFKGGKKNKQCPSSYRPISLLPAVSKITEKIIQIQLVQHMDRYGLWNGSLHSYRKNLSSTTALAQVTDCTIAASEEKKIAAAIAVDESAAFDTIDHEILLNKLRLYRIHENTIAWLRDYLTARTEYVTIGGQDSKMEATSSGVPQGSILGPILFNIYINDFAEIVKDHEKCTSSTHNPGEKLFGSSCNICGNLTTYADDAVYVTTNTDRSKNQDRLSEILDRITTYLNDNKMSINPTKTILWELMNSQKACKVKGNPPKLNTSDSQGNVKIVQPSKNEKCLGGNIQNNLQWQAMLETGEDALIPTLRKKLGILKFLGKNIPQKCRLLLANGLLIGRINYLLPLYGGAPEKYIHKIQVIMNNSARFVTGAGRRAKSRDLMDAVKWLNIREMTQLHTSVLAWKTIKLGTPQHLADNIHLAQDNNIYTTIPRLQHTQQSLRWRMCQDWNALPPEIKEINSLPRFKHRVKSWIKSSRVTVPPVPPAPPDSSPTRAT